MGKELGLENLYIKRDDLSGKVYGGNKPRKLEFILGDALRNKAKEVLTFGAAGSNHCLATAIYAQQLGIKSISMVIPQPNAHYVRHNLLMSYYCGVELHLCPSMRLFSIESVYQLLRHKFKYAHFPQIIPPGGSSPLGIIGFVNAAFELKEQVMKGEIPEPDYIYVASGSLGTGAGLILGLRAANLKSQVISIQVTRKKLAIEKAMVKLINRTNSLLRLLDPSFPCFEFSERDTIIRYDFSGKEYALFTKEGLEAVTMLERSEGIKLDGTYTGKAFAALIDDAKKRDLRAKVILFWNTYNSRDFSDMISTVDYHDLPREFHRYFEEAVQPLDRDK